MMNSKCIRLLLPFFAVCFSGWYFLFLSALPTGAAGTPSSLAVAPMGQPSTNFITLNATNHISQQIYPSDSREGTYQFPHVVVFRLADDRLILPFYYPNYSYSSICSYNN